MMCDEMNLDKFPMNSVSCFEDQMRDNSVLLLWKCFFTNSVIQWEDVESDDTPLLV